MPHPMARVERMFAFLSTQVDSRPPVPDDLRQRVTPIVQASARTIPVAPALASLLPAGALQRGTVTVLAGTPGSGATSLGVSLLAEASSAGHWCAAIGFEDPGVVAMAELGMDLRRAVFVPRVRGRWADAAAELLDGVELVLLSPPSRVSYGVARRLVGRVRERKVALIIVTDQANRWPVPPEITMKIVESSWHGAGLGDGSLAARRAEIVVEHRGDDARAKRASIWLPSVNGSVSLAEIRR